MPWSETSAMDQKRLFIKDYIRYTFSFAEICRRYGISRPTGYKWIARFEASGLSGFEALPLDPRSNVQKRAPPGFERTLVARRPFGHGRERHGFLPNRIGGICRTGHGDLLCSVWLTLSISCEASWREACASTGRERLIRQLHAIVRWWHRSTPRSHYARTTIILIYLFDHWDRRPVGIEHIDSDLPSTIRLPFPDG